MRGVRLIVMDSVASLARKEFNSASLIERTEVLATQAAILKSVDARPRVGARRGSPRPSRRGACARRSH